MAPYNPPSAHYAHIDLCGYTDDQLQSIVGKNGCNLYAMTSSHKLKYVWMDFDKKRLELWGSFGVFAAGAD